MSNRYAQREDRRQTRTTIVCVAPPGVWPATFCGVHQSHWPSGEPRCQESVRLVEAGRGPYR